MESIFKIKSLDFSQELRWWVNEFFLSEMNPLSSHEFPLTLRHSNIFTLFQSYQNILY